MNYPPKDSKKKMVKFSENQNFISKMILKNLLDQIFEEKVESEIFKIYTRTNNLKYLS